MIIETEHLIIRDFQKKDAAGLLEAEFNLQMQQNSD